MRKRIFKKRYVMLGNIFYNIIYFISYYIIKLEKFKEGKEVNEVVIDDSVAVLTSIPIFRVVNVNVVNKFSAVLWSR